MNVLFVDLENVCRSPLAEAILKKKFKEHHIHGEVDSAGFESFTINEPPDKRVVNVALKHGYAPEGMARIFRKEDFDLFDKIYVMDTQNYNDVMALAKKDQHKEKVEYLLDVLDDGKNKTVPNPYNTGESDCENIFELLDKATDKIVELARAEKQNA
ncbi:low molecular weight phosphotyrosine protein phosphatase [Candidatus Sulfidibacterium hydrothermale]|uniref:low molecular weight protein-tyrosine-phosphatase n=1 Tax=Candidatus Sulfidibacterium hydrothermale TaxID=2875962 RepID=UPI001F0B05B7|nr:low molecular weight protein-tyrosine-phosphatase [Candidatus Sulfidibacterium hydrothermale]UBM62894.1 low molecular weight phosphotyrosine protein phosphatase [Candidatus Sulfidibacterium hydrothermale]